MQASVRRPHSVIALRCHQVGRQLSLLRARKIGSRLCSRQQRRPTIQWGWQPKTERFQSSTTLGAESRRLPLDGCGSICTNSSRVPHCVCQYGLRCRIAVRRSWRVTIPESVVTSGRSSPAASKTFVSSVCFRLIFELLVNPDHVQPSQFSHCCPDRIILGHGHQIVVVREPTMITRL